MSNDNRGLSLFGWRSPRWWRMTSKELRETLRDRRTIITLIGMPLLIYPLLGVTMQKLLVSQLQSQSKVEYRIALERQSDQVDFQKLFRIGHRFVGIRETGTFDPGVPPAGTLEDPLIQLLAPENPDVVADVTQLVENRTSDVGVRLVRQAEEMSLTCEVVYRPDSIHSRSVRSFVEERFRAVNEAHAGEVFSRDITKPQSPFFVKSIPLPKQTGPGGEAARGPHGEPLAAGAALGWAAAFGSFSSECSINPANGMLFAISAYSSVKPACEATNSPGWRWLLLSG